MMSRTVGLIGVGAMGAALLERLLLAGHRVKAYDIAEAGRAAGRAGGAEVMDSIAAASTGVEIIHVFVRTDDEVLDVAIGPHNILSAASKGTIVLLHSTTLPATAQKIARMAAGCGIEVLDVPVTSVPRRVREGECSFLVGGSPAIAEIVRPYLQSLGGDYYYFGDLGKGNIAKLAKNLVNAAERVVLREALTMVQAGGLDLRLFMSMMFAEDKGSLVAQWEKAFSIDGDTLVTHQGSNIFSKDLPLAADYAETIGLDLPLTREANRFAKTLTDGG